MWGTEIQDTTQTPKTTSLEYCAKGILSIKIAIISH